MKRWLVFVTSVLLVLLMLTACTPLDEPEDVTPPEVPDEVTLDFHITAPPMTPIHTSVGVLSDMLNTNHPWLHASWQESDLPAAINNIAEMPAEEKKHALPTFVPAMDFLTARAGAGPDGHKYEQELTDLMYVGNYNIEAFTFLTLDPELAQDPQKLTGKRIGTPYEVEGEAIGSPQLICNALLQDAWGVADNVTYIESVPMPAAAGMLTDDVLDAVFWGNLSLRADGGFNILGPQYGTLGRVQVYWIPVSQADIDLVNANNIWQTDLLEVPAGSIVIPGIPGGTVNPPEDITVARFGSAIVAWEETEDDVVYELLTFLNDNAAAFSAKTGLPMGLDILADFPPGVTKDMFHPGAVRFFEEHGITIGE